MTLGTEGEWRVGLGFKGCWGGGNVDGDARTNNNVYTQLIIEPAALGIQLNTHDECDAYMDWFAERSGSVAILLSLG